MQTIVKATCPACGDVELAPSDIQLRVCSTPSATIYVFDCTRCEMPIVKPAADERIVALLMSVGVPVVYWALPAELDEVHAGPPLTLDDLIDLRLALDGSDFLAQLMRADSH